MLPQAARKMWAPAGHEHDSNSNIFNSMLNASGFAAASQMDPTLLRYLSQEVSQVRCASGSETDYQRMSKSSITSLANSSAITGMSPGGISPTSSLAGPLLDCQTLSNPNSNHSPTSTAAFNPDQRLGCVSDLTSLSCASPTIITQLSPEEASASGSADVNNSETSSASLPGQVNSCPTSIVVTATTDATHAAGLVNFSLSQAGITSFVLVAPLGATNSPGSQATLCGALRVAISARRIHRTTGPPTDLAIMPVFSTMPMPRLDSTASQNGQNQFGGEGLVECVNVHVYQVSAGLAPAPGSAQQLRIDMNTPPMILVMQLTQAVLGQGPNGDGSLRTVEVMFGPAATRASLQVLTHTHCQLASLGHEVLMLPNQAEGGTSTSHFSVFLVPPTPSTSQQVHAATRIAMEAQAMQAHAMQQLLALGQPDIYPVQDATAAAMAMLQPNFSSRSAPQVNFSGLTPGGMGFNSGLTGGSASMNPYQMLGVMGGPAGNKQMGAAAMGWQHGMQKALSMPFGGLGMEVLEAASAAAAAAASTGAMAQLSAAAAVQQLQQQQQQQVSTNGSNGGNAGSQASIRLRARKADWVIVTEDTAIKNAAGAVAKVLSRMSVQGLCCPVFMERKTARYTGVVSVAVKAIAVARGYVHNEGSGHEVGFQPYIRGDVSSCSFNATRPPGAPSMSAADAARSEQLNAQLLTSLASGDLAALELLRMGGSPPLGMSPRASGSSLRGGSPPLMGGSPTGWNAEMARNSTELNGGSAGSSVCGEEDGGPWSDLEQAELAFDVYKVMLHQEVHEGNSQPVKVTAHSRPGVVSSIICKLVLERQSAVLITAGGRAMHVAMLAVVVARQRLQAQGVDILLLPKFITVDTTSTLGWESVFLKFSIIKWSAAASLAAEMSSKLNLSRTST